MSQERQQIVLASFGESWPSSAEPRRITYPLRQISSGIYAGFTAGLPKL
jgi:hypothetical protein